MTVSHILKQKGPQVETVRPDTSLQDVIDVLARKKIGAVVVMEPQSGVVGILSERDIVHALSQHGPASLANRADSAMTRGVVTCKRSDTAEGLMEVMTRGRFRHVPVVEDGRLLGIVSIGDVVKQRIEESDLERHAMREYITTAGS